MKIIGDVHGKIQRYMEEVNGVNETVQLGDFGFKHEHDWFLQSMNVSKHKILFGNHDYYPYLDKEHSITSNFFFDTEILYIRGAYSIDKHYRLAGLDWFENEQLSYSESNDLIDEVKERTTNKRMPTIFITHDCPYTVYKEVFDIHDKNLTNQMLEAIWQTYQPRLWIHGHHHKEKRTRMNGTFFVSLGELNSYIL